MRRTLPLLLAPALLITSGAVHGVWTQRWASSAEIDRAVALLPGVTTAVGDWRSEEGEELDSRQAAVGEIQGSLLRTYTNPRRRAKLTVLVVCGRPGPIAVHTPDVCYSARGYGIAGKKDRQQVQAESMAEPADFETAVFRRATSSGPDRMRIFWSWYAGGKWQVKGNPRIAFARQPVLYKLYVIRSMTRPNEPLEEDVAQDFLKQFLPALQDCLASSS
jgi:Protein of unknown function (DUF3485)